VNKLIEIVKKISPAKNVTNTFSSSLQAMLRTPSSLSFLGASPLTVIPSDTTSFLLTVIPSDATSIASTSRGIQMFLPEQKYQKALLFNVDLSTRDKSLGRDDWGVLMLGRDDWGC
jgi:hypothetical protein